MPVMNKDRFIHLRFFNRDTKEIRPFGGYTFCYIPSVEGDLSVVAVAKCSMHDNFNKKIGRSISLGRAIDMTDGFSHIVHRSLSYEELHDMALRIALDDIQTQAKRHGYSYGDIDIVSPGNPIVSLT